MAYALAKELGKTPAKLGLNLASFNVWATLWCAGATYSLLAGDLMEAKMATSGTVTKGIDQVLKEGPVARAPNCEDKNRFWSAFRIRALPLSIRP